jgi:SAM-dependent methyltransferase
MDEPDSSQTVFWQRRWERGKLPWDMGGVPRELVEFLTRTRNESRLPSRVLIPGCGSGYEVRAFHEASQDVMAIDFSATAVTHAREVLGLLGDKVVQGNFFKYDFGSTRFGIIYERGFLCSLPGHKHPDYVARMSSLLSPGGRLVGVFLYGEEPEPPPYPLTDVSAEALFGKNFRLIRSEPMAGSVDVYQGMERWQEWERV